LRTLPTDDATLRPKVREALQQQRDALK